MTRPDKNIVRKIRITKFFVIYVIFPVKISITFVMSGTMTSTACPHSTVTLFARLRGLSTSVPRAHAVWYASSCSGTTCRIGESTP